MKRCAFVAVLLWVLTAPATAGAQALPGQAFPDLAFDPVNNLFCATYVNVASPPPHALAVQIVSPSGAPIGGATEVAPSPDLVLPQIAFDDALQDYLVVVAVGDVYGQLIGSDGGKKGSLLTLDATAGDQNLAAIAFDTVNRRFLVAWIEEAGADQHVVGRLILGDGTPVGDPFPIYTATTVGDRSPQIAYDRIHQRFLVVWDDPRLGAPNVFGQLINADGAPQGVDFPISEAGAGNKLFPEVAFDDANQRFLVAWGDERNGTWDIYGQLVGADRNLIGGNKAIFTGVQSQETPNVAFEAATQRYLVVWAHTTNGTDYTIQGRYVGADGMPSGADFQVSTGQAEQLKPAIAANDLCPNFLVAYADTAAPTVLQYAVEGDPCETTPPTVASTSPAADAVDIAVDAPITATFSEAMRASTITAGTFTLSGGVTGTVTYDQATNVATFTPASPLANATAYTATITTGVKDLVGNTMAADSAWSFTTVAVTPPPDSGGGCSLMPR